MLAIGSILVPVDVSPGAGEALAYALALRSGAASPAAGAKIVVTHAAGLPPSTGLWSLPVRTLEELRAGHRERLVSFVRGVCGEGPNLHLEVLDGDARTVIPERASGFDLVVLGARSAAHAGDLTPGGVAECIIRRARPPVITVKWATAHGPLEGKRPLAPRRIILATDFTPASFEALRYAMSLALAYDATLTALHVVTDVRALRDCARLPFPLAEQIDRFYETELQWGRDELGRFIHDRLGADRPVEVREVVRAGKPAREIAAACMDDGADLLVMAKHGGSGWGRFFLGSVAEEALRLAPCPVLTVHPPEA